MIRIRIIKGNKNKRGRRVGENTRTIQKLIRTQTLSTVKLRPHVTAYA